MTDIRAECGHIYGVWSSGYETDIIYDKDAFRGDDGGLCIGPHGEEFNFCPICGRSLKEPDHD